MNGAFPNVKQFSNFMPSQVSVLVSKRILKRQFNCILYSVKAEYRKPCVTLRFYIKLGGNNNLEAKLSQKGC